MVRPAGEVAESGEYFELYNRTSRDVSLAGFFVRRAASGDTLVKFEATEGNVVVPAKGFLVVGQSADPFENDGANVAYAYGTARPRRSGAIADPREADADGPADLHVGRPRGDGRGAGLRSPTRSFSPPTRPPPLPTPSPARWPRMRCSGARPRPSGERPGAPRGVSTTPTRTSRWTSSTSPRIPRPRRCSGPRPLDLGMVTIDLSEMPIPAFGTERTELKVNPNGWLTFKMSVTSTRRRTAPRR